MTRKIDDGELDQILSEMGSEPARSRRMIDPNVLDAFAAKALPEDEALEVAEVLLDDPEQGRLLDLRFRADALTDQALRDAEAVSSTAEVAESDAIYQGSDVESAGARWRPLPWAMAAAAVLLGVFVGSRVWLDDDPDPSPESVEVASLEGYTLGVADVGGGTKGLALGLGPGQLPTMSVRAGLDLELHPPRASGPRPMPTLRAFAVELTEPLASLHALETSPRGRVGSGELVAGTYAMAVSTTDGVDRWLDEARAGIRSRVSDPARASRRDFEIALAAWLRENPPPPSRKILILSLE